MGRRPVAARRSDIWKLPQPPAVPEMPTADTKVVCPVAGEEVDIANAVLS